MFERLGIPVGEAWQVRVSRRALARVKVLEWNIRQDDPLPSSRPNIEIVVAVPPYVTRVRSHSRANIQDPQAAPESWLIGKREATVKPVRVRSPARACYRSARIHERLVEARQGFRRDSHIVVDHSDRRSAGRDGGIDPSVPPSLNIRWAEILNNFRAARYPDIRTCRDDHGSLGRNTRYTHQVLQEVVAIPRGWHG
jgi:hypothetical protein